MELNERIPAACATRQSPKEWAASVLPPPGKRRMGRRAPTIACVSAPVANVTLDNDNRADEDSMEQGKYVRRRL
jgi:hypothetical protein